MEVKQHITQIIERLAQSPLYHDKNFTKLPEIRKELELLYAKLDQPLHAAILGEVKAGKSTLLNAFAGGDISPTNTTETTACILKITYGTDEEGCIYYKDGSQIVSSIESVYQTLSEHRQEPEFFSHIDYIVIKKNLTGLKHMYLIDTPGLETITALNEEKTTQYFQAVDVVLWVFNGNYLGQSDVNEHLRHLSRMGKPIVAIINRIDQVDGDPQELVDYLDEQLGIYVQAIFPLSAQKAYDGIMTQDTAAVEESGFSALYQYLDEHIERKADQVQMESIVNSVKALEEQIELLHKQAMEQIEMKMRTYLELDEQIQYNGNLMMQKIMSRTQTWVQHDFLSNAEQTIRNRINDQSFFSTTSKDAIQRELEQLLSEDRLQQEINGFLGQLQSDIYREWHGRLSQIDAELTHLYQENQIKNDLEISQLRQAFAGQTGMDSMKDSVLIASAAGGALSVYSAILGPAASTVTIGSAVGAIMPPILLAGAAVGLVSGYARSKKLKSSQNMMANDVLDRIRSHVLQELLPSLEQHLQQLCSKTADEAKREFVEKNFDGRSVDELKDLVQQLQSFLKREDGEAFAKLSQYST